MVKAYSIMTIISFILGTAAAGFSLYLTFSNKTFCVDINNVETCVSNKLGTGQKVGFTIAVLIQWLIELCEYILPASISPPSPPRRRCRLRHIFLRAGRTDFYLFPSISNLCARQYDIGGDADLPSSYTDIVVIIRRYVEQLEEEREYRHEFRLNPTTGGTYEAKEGLLTQGHYPYSDSNNAFGPNRA